MIVSGRKFGRVLVVAAAVIFGFLPASTLATDPVPISPIEGFELGLPVGAINVGTGTVVALTSGAHSGVRRFQFVGDTDPTTVSSLTLAPVDVTGYSNVSLEFASKFNFGIEGNDLAAVRVSSFDNPLLTPIIVPFSNQPTGDWSIVTIDLPAELSNHQLSFSFTADFNSASGDAWSIDDVGFFGTPVPEPATLALLSLGALTAIRRRSQ